MHDDKVVSVHFFKPSGKWYTTETYTFSDDVDPEHAQSMVIAALDGRFSTMDAVVIDGPWGFPVMWKGLP